MKKIAILISGRGSNMLALQKAVEEHTIPAHLILVLSSNRNSLGLERAQEIGLNTAIVDRRNYQDRLSFEKAMFYELRKYQIDLIVLAGFMHILSPSFVEDYAGKIINIHPSLLPKYKGLHTHRRAINSGDPIHGLTIHFVTPELDSGPAILQKVIQVHKQDTETDLARRLLEHEHICLVHAVRWIINGDIVLSEGKVIFKGEVLGKSGVHLDEETDLGQFPFH